MKNVHSETAEFARTPHEEHGLNVSDTRSVGQQFAVAPVNDVGIAQKEPGAVERSVLAPVNAGRSESRFLRTLIETRQRIAARRERTGELPRRVATSSL